MITMDDKNVVRRVTKEAPYVGPHVFEVPGPYDDWKDHVHPAVREVWWELDMRTRSLIAMAVQHARSKE